MSNEVKVIGFDGGELLGVRDENGNVYLAVKKACIDIGLTENQARSEIKKIQESLLFKSNCVKFDTVQTEGSRQVNREVIGIHEKFVPMWLAQINLTPSMQKNNPETVKRLLTYQLSAADVLHKAFAETEEQAHEFYSEMGFKGDIANINGVLNDLDGKVELLSNYVTINSHQAQQLFKSGKNRVSILLGGAKSLKYKKNSKTYFKNMWIQFCEKFGVTSYKDLSPVHIDSGYEFLKEWKYA